LRLARFFGQASVELSIGALVLVSVALTLIEFTFGETATTPRQQAILRGVVWSNDILTLLFIVELSLRFLATPSKRTFFRVYWIDIIAVLPVFRVFRAARAFRLLRLVRLLRMFGVVSRLASHFPYVLRRGAVEYMVVCGLLALTVVFGTGAMLYFEGHRGDSAVADGKTLDLEGSFWFSIYSLFAGEPIPGPPRTVGGRIVTVFVMFMGLTIFAMFTGTVSAFMVERLQGKGVNVAWNELCDHVIICGWNTKAEIIIREFLASSFGERRQIVAVTQWEHEPPLLSDELESRVIFYNEDFTRITVLEHVGIHRASTCIILSDITGGRSEQDADARTILAALTVEKLNPAVYTCAELLNRSYGSHLKMGQVNDYVVSGEYAAYLLAQAAMNRGLMDVFSELLTYQKGNEFYRTALPESWLGRTYLELFSELKTAHNAVLVSVQLANGQMLINPVDHTFSAGEEIVVIAEDELRW
jgi:voltage-gated potassium channel